MENTIKIGKQLEKLLSKSTYAELDVAQEFNNIIARQFKEYCGTTKDKLKSFFEDLQKGGCQSGMIAEFIYHTDCKSFYIANIEDLEGMKEDLEENYGEPIQNSFKTYHYTFVCWL